MKVGGPFYGYCIQDHLRLLNRIDSERENDRAMVKVSGPLWVKA